MNTNTWEQTKEGVGRAWLTGVFWAALLAVGGDTVTAGESGAAAPVFRAAPDGGFEFDTGLLRGRLAKAGRPLGLTDVVHARTGARVDSSNGLLSYYRVFTRGKRYGGGAWDWPCRAKLTGSGAAEIQWPAEEGRPFDLAAEYEWVTPSVLEVRTSVKAVGKLEAFEVFLASYFGSAFTNAMVLLDDSAGSGGEGAFRRAAKEWGDWQMFARDDGARALILDGRWKLPPNPVEWALFTGLSKPVGARRAEGLGIGFALVGLPGDCFAVATPHESEGHYSMYLSLWGRDFEAGQRSVTRVRLALLEGAVERRALEAYRRLVSP